MRGYILLVRTVKATDRYSIRCPSCGRHRSKPASTDTKITWLFDHWRRSPNCSLGDGAFTQHRNEPIT